MISDRQKQGAAVIFFLSGVVLLVVAFVAPWRDHNAPEGLQQTETPVDFASLSLVEYATDAPWALPSLLESSDMIALFKIYVTTCSPCVSEVSEYGRLIKEEQIEGTRIVPLVLVVEEDPAKARRFIKLIDLDLPVAFLSSESFAQLVSDADARAGYLNELFFINRRSEKILFRLILPGNAMTALSYKRAVLQHVTS